MARDSFLEKLQQSFDESYEGAVISNISRPEQPIIYCNSTFLELTGYSRDEIIGRNCRFLQKDDRNQEGLDTIRKAIRKKNSCKVVLRNYKKNGELFYNRLSIFPLRTPELEDEYFVGLQDDVTNIIKTEEKLGRAKDENLVLRSEVHHRVKNNLAIFSSLLQADSLNKEESLIILKNQMRVQAMSFVYERLYQREGLSRIDFSDYTRCVLDFLKDSELQEETYLEFETDISEGLELNVNQAIPFSLLLSELINNVYRHAYPTSGTGSIFLGLDQENGTVKAVVEDNGVGIPEQLNTDYPQTPGMLITQSLCQQLEGKLTYENRSGGGLRVELLFPKSDARGSSQAFPIPDLS